VYVSDIKTNRATERIMEIKGEAVNRILKRDKKIKLYSAEKIIVTRNRFIHGYDEITDDLIWSIVIDYLPKLKNEVTVQLDKKGCA
jgi:uncharacterized protein with HEPN domain